jgi:hypothetical protein
MMGLPFTYEEQGNQRQSIHRLGSSRSEGGNEQHFEDAWAGFHRRVGRGPASSAQQTDDSASSIGRGRVRPMADLRTIRGRFRSVIILCLQERCPYYSVHAVRGRINYISIPKNLSFFFKYENELAASSHTLGHTIVLAARGPCWSRNHPRRNEWISLAGDPNRAVPGARYLRSARWFH